MREVTIDGIKYVLDAYDYGTQLEIDDRSFSTEFDMVQKKMIPKMKPGVHKLLMIKYSLKSWTFKGVKDGALVAGDVPILPISEDTIKTLPSRHGSKLHDISESLNSVSEEEAKNS